MPALQDGQPVVEAKNLGVKFSLSNKRDDIKSSLFNLLFHKKKKCDKKEFWALQGVDLDAFKGEIIGIIGSNGAGKSTLCRVISKLLKPDAGSIVVRGDVSALLSLGTGFNKELTGKENIYLNGMMLGFSKKEIDRLYHEIVDFSGIDSFIEQPLKYYSSGMQSRLGFSIAAMLEPEILVLDEALSTGDISFKEKSAGKMKEIVDRARVVLIVSHDIDFIAKKCSKTIWIENGTVKAFGKSGDVCEQYKREATPKTKKKKSIICLKESERIIGEETIIKVSDLSLKYKLQDKEIWALKNVNFTVNKGEILGIIGQNGAGKSTLCKALSQILRQDEGNIEINGHVATLFGFGTGFNSQLSGADNIYLNGLMLGLPRKRIEQSYDDIIDFSGLGSYIHAPVKNYSSGMKSRLGFSIASMLEPDIFIIDEALAVGDASFYEKASEKMQEMIAASKAVIVVTHSMRFVEKVCTRALWLDKGEVMYDGDPKDAVMRYREYTKKRKTDNAN